MTINRNSRLLNGKMTRQESIAKAPKNGRLGPPNRTKRLFGISFSERTSLRSAGAHSRPCMTGTSFQMTAMST